MIKYGGSPAFPEIEQIETTQTDVHDDFYNKVKEMRRLQKCYFKFRRESDLQASKALEKEVDLILDDFFTPKLF